jgi:hypothetical protein
MHKGIILVDFPFGVRLSQINEDRAAWKDDSFPYRRSTFMKSPEKSAFETILIVAVALALVLLPLAAKAESHGKHKPPPFTEFDHDGDGFVSEDEFNSTRAARMAAMRAPTANPCHYDFGPSTDSIN